MSLAAFQTVEACAEVAAASSQFAVRSWWTVSSFAWISGVWVVCVCVFKFLFDVTSTFTYVRTSFSGLRRCVCVFCSSSSDARDPVLVVVCSCGFV